ncbi:MAG: VOC family protein, partial [Thermoproteota archaeon]
QIGIVVRSIEKSIEAWEKLLGVKASGIVETEPLEKTGMKYKGRAAEGRAKLAFLQLENITIELIEPVGIQHLEGFFTDAWRGCASHSIQR